MRKLNSEPISEPNPVLISMPTMAIQSTAKRQPAWGGRWAARAGAMLVTGGLVGGLLVGCGSMQPSARPLVYDFGPGSVAAPATAANNASTATAQPAIVLHEVEGGASLETTALLYRLGYADAQALRPYAQARWSMAPAQLMRQRLREVLGQSRNVLAPVDAQPGSLPGVRIEMEEFSQWFDSPQASSALVRVRATLVQPGKPAQQTTLLVKQPAPTPDAAGGARALAQATDAIAAQLDQWLRQSIASSP